MIIMQNSFFDQYIQKKKYIPTTPKDFTNGIFYLYLKQNDVDICEIKKYINIIFNITKIAILINGETTTQIFISSSSWLKI